MNDESTGLSHGEKELLLQLRNLRDKLQDRAWTRYGRGDSFSTLVFGRKEKGRRLLGTEATLFDSSLIYGDITIGDHSHISQHVVLDGTGGLTIGDYCSVASGVRIQTHDSSKWALTGGKAKYDYAPVVIHECCFIGTNSVITSGVSIGPHSMVAAGAVVTKDVPPYTIVAGVPAHVVGKVVVQGDQAELVYDRKRDKWKDDGR